MISKQDIKVSVEEITDEEAMECGFKQEHMSGKRGDSLEFELRSGAGCGSPWITATIKRDGVNHYYRIDARNIMTDIIALSGTSVVESATGS